MGGAGAHSERAIARPRQERAEPYMFSFRGDEGCDDVAVAHSVLLHSKPSILVCGSRLAGLCVQGRRLPDCKALRRFAGSLLNALRVCPPCHAWAHTQPRRSVLSCQTACVVTPGGLSRKQKATARRIVSRRVPAGQRRVQRGELNGEHTRAWQQRRGFCEQARLPDLCHCRVLHREASERSLPVADAKGARRVRPPNVSSTSTSVRACSPSSAPAMRHATRATRLHRRWASPRRKRAGPHLAASARARLTNPAPPRDGARACALDQPRSAAGRGDRARGAATKRRNARPTAFWLRAARRQNAHSSATREATHTNPGSPGCWASAP